MYYSLFEVFSIGIGPSSSHTVGPMRAAVRFVDSLCERGIIKQTEKVKVMLYGSLALTGVGHGTPSAIVYGLLGLRADTMDLSQNYIQEVQSSGMLSLGKIKKIKFSMDTDIVLNKEIFLQEHSNGMKFIAFTADGKELLQETYFSVGGGSVCRSDEMGKRMFQDEVDVPYPFNTSAELIEQCKKHNLSIADIVLKNEEKRRSPDEIKEYLALIDKIMQAGIERGCKTSGILPGGLGVQRRAPIIYRRLEEKFHANDEDPLMIIDWINLWAFAVAEENASGGQIVTAPTMGSAGILPAVLRYFERFASKKSPFDVKRGKEIFLLTASAICSLYRSNASISGAEVGCQGEVGVACSMASAGLVAALNGTVVQIENAAEIAMEHNLGLTCDPVCGLVQVPCIERNAIAAVKAVNAARLALRGNGNHVVSLDGVIKTMYETGKNLPEKYKETSLAGLAVHALTC
ncbi:MAG: L-serine ammonia-lyase [Alphaproteobacteria bacterium]|nr:L-serine ammonia-lyase [Alphaproteobacteria bacterium]